MYKCGASSKSRLNKFYDCCDVGGTWTFWPWYGRGDIRRSACARWSSVCPFQTVLCCVESIHCHHLIWSYASRVSVSDHLTWYKPAVDTRFVTFSNAVNYSSQLIFSFFGNVRQTTSSSCFLLVFQLYCIYDYLLICLFHGVLHISNYVLVRFIHGYFAVLVQHNIIT